MTKIAIFGVGLIGGSLALCFKGKPGYHIVGHSYNPASVKKYLARGVVDEATTNMGEAAADADFIFLCVPVDNIREYMSKLSELPLKPGAVVTDVGSTKLSIVEASRLLDGKDVYFIGGHPMAGSERTGVEAAFSHLFENAFYVLTPDETTSNEAYNRLESLLRLTKAHIIKMDPRQHDDIVGAVSHLPHIIAVALVNLVSRYNDSNDLYEQLAAGGFRDLTRIASGDPVMWRDILLNNRGVMLKLLSDWNEEIERFIYMIESSDGDAIAEAFRSAGSFRNRLPERRKGMITSLHDIYVDVPDTPGIIGKITTHLGDRRINLSNIQIIESRLDVPGVLRLSFRSDLEMRQAKNALLQIGCSIHY